MKPDTVTRELASDLAPSNVTGSTTFAAQQVIAGKDSQAAFKPEFIERCALLTAEEFWDVRLLLHRAFPKDGFGPRGEFSRRVKAAQRDLDPIERRAGWSAGLLLNDSGAAKPVLANAVLALQLAPEWAGVLAYDEFAKRSRIVKATPWGREGSDWSDYDDKKLAVWLQQSGILVNVSTASDAAVIGSHDHTVHPVRDYLNSLHPGPENLLDSWLWAFLGVRPNGNRQADYISAVGRRWLISAVARIFEPGAKADCCLVLEGRTGVGKSTALKTLADPWFMDSPINLDDKDYMMNIQGKWIVEIADLVSYNKSEIEQVKLALSSTCDRFRWSYGRISEDHDRQCVFACTTEVENWSKETEARRFWPVLVGTIDTNELKANKDQLWGEAVAAYKAGAKWHLDDADLIAASRQEQEARYENHPWTKKVGDFVSQLESVTCEDILGMAIIKPLERQTKTDQIIVGGCLRSLGWSRRQVRDQERDGRRVWRWYPPRTED